MLTEVQNDILTVLDTITAFKERGVWQGNMDELVKQPQKMPSVHIALATGSFGGPTTVPPQSSMVSLGWDIIIIYQCLRDRRISSDQGFGLIESVAKPVSAGGLTGLKTQGGQLWPSSLELLDTVNGISAYALRFEIERRIT